MRRFLPVALVLTLWIASACSAVGDPEPIVADAPQESTKERDTSAAEQATARGQGDRPPQEYDENASRGAREDLAGSGQSSRPEAPKISGTTIDGEEISLADFRGKPVFVKVYASW